MLRSLLAGLDTLLSPLTPLVIILIWHVGLIWLLNQAFRQWGLKHSRGQIALALSATIIAASIHALYSLQSFYWFIASTAYTLPLALLILYLGMTFETGRRSRSNLLLALFAVGGAVICFDQRRRLRNVPRIPASGAIISHGDSVLHT